MHKSKSLEDGKEYVPSRIMGSMISNSTASSQSGYTIF